MSIGSNGCVMKLFTDCTVALQTVSTVTIRFDAATFDTMATCTKAEYKSDDRPDKCDYQKAQCTFDAEGDVGASPVACEVRRKGSSTWREMTDKPSFKIKGLASDVHFGTSACGGSTGAACPPGETVNRWQSDRFTLNNNGFPSYYTTNGEVDAYDAFRATGKKAVPSAHYVRVVLRRGDEVVREDTYAMIETISDKAFMRKWFGKDYALWEVEHDAVEGPKKDGGVVEDLIKDGNLTVPDLLDLPRAYLDETDMVDYYIGEELTGHWDGACLREMKNNYYVAYDAAEWTIIPSGVDNTFQGCVTELLSTGPTCAFMKECFADAECAARYEQRLASARSVVSRVVPSCWRELLPVWFAILCVAAWVVALRFVAWMSKDVCECSVDAP